MEKPKRKRGKQLESPLDFVAPHELSKCAEMLQGQLGRRISLHFYDCKLEIILSDEENDVRQFLLTWKPFNYHVPKLPFLMWSLPLPTASGYLKRWGRESTHVIIKPVAPILTYLLLSSLFLFPGVLSLIGFLDVAIRKGEIAFQLLLFTGVLGSIGIKHWIELGALKKEFSDIIGASLYPEKFGRRRIRPKS